MQKLYNSFRVRQDKFNSFEHKDEFREYVHKLAVDSLKTVRNEQKKFDEQNLVFRILYSNPTMKARRKQISSIRDRVTHLNEVMTQNMQRYKEREISIQEFDDIRCDVDELLEYYYEKIQELNSEYGKVSDLPQYKRRRRLMMSFRIDDLEPHERIFIPQFFFRNKTTINFLIEEYCRWFNNVKFKEEIEDQQRETKNRKRREDRAMKTSDQEKKRKKNQRKLKKYLDSPLSYGEISRITEIPKTTVRRLLIDMRG